MSARSVQIWFQNRRQRDPSRVRKPQHKPVIGRLAIDDALPLVTESEKQRVARSVAQLAPTPSPPKHPPPMQPPQPPMNAQRRWQLPPQQQPPHPPQQSQQSQQPQQSQQQRPQQ